MFFRSLRRNKNWERPPAKGPILRVWRVIWGPVDPSSTGIISQYVSFAVAADASRVVLLARKKLRHSGLMRKGYKAFVDVDTDPYVPEEGEKVYIVHVGPRPLRRTVCVMAKDADFLQKLLMSVADDADCIRYVDADLYERTAIDIRKEGVY